MNKSYKTAQTNADLNIRYSGPWPTLCKIVCTVGFSISLVLALLSRDARNYMHTVVVISEKAKEQNELMFETAFS